MVKRLCGNYDRTEDATLYYRCCADEIMARALSLQSGDRWKRFHCVLAATPPVQPRLME